MTLWKDTLNYNMLNIPTGDFDGVHAGNIKSCLIVFKIDPASGDM